MLQLLKRTDAVTPRGSNHDIGYRGVTASVLFSSCRIVNLPRIFLSRAVPLKVHAFYASRKSCARFVKISGDLEQSRAISSNLAPVGTRPGAGPRGRPGGLDRYQVNAQGRCVGSSARVERLR